jgi:mRNA interferase RelE/StbE
MESVERELASMDRPVHRSIAAKIGALADDPRPHGVEQLKGEEGELRIRVHYRVIYQVHDASATVLVIRVGHPRPRTRS